MKLILVRHGNTFRAEEAVVMTGLTEDYQLVPRGKEQAEEVAGFIQELIVKEELQPEKIIAANLKRTQETAEIIAEKLLIPVDFTPRLNEIDYGAWAAKTNQDIYQLGGYEALELWNKESVWPQAFKTKFTEIKDNLDIIINTNNPHSTVIVVSSNGILRYFLEYLPGEFQKRVEMQDFKMKTGHVSFIEIGEEPKVFFWNKNPNENSEKLDINK